MQIAIKGHHIEVTPALDAYIRQRLDRLKGRLSKATHVVVSLAGKKKNGLVPSIQIAVHFAGRQTIVIKEFLKKTVADFYTTVGVAFDALANGIETFAGKIDKKHQRERAGKIRTKLAMA